MFYISLRIICKFIYMLLRAHLSRITLARSYTKSNRFNDFLIHHVRQHRASATPFNALIDQLHSNANVRLPHILPHENLGRSKNNTTPTDLAHGIVTIAHVLPSRNKVVLASGFAVLDGGLLVTCAHTFYQAADHPRSTEPDPHSQSIAITCRGELMRVVAIVTHLVSSDLVVIRLEENRRLPSLSVDPYPAPVSTLLLSYDFVAASLSANSRSLPSPMHGSQPKFFSTRVHAVRKLRQEPTTNSVR